MEASRLIHWIQNPASLDNQSLALLKEALDAYPCFTTLRMLYQKNLLVLNDNRFDVELVRTALAAPDRRRLFLFMEGLTSENLPGGLSSDQAAPTSDFSLIDRFLRQASEKNEPAEVAMQEQQDPIEQPHVATLHPLNDTNLDEYGLAGFSLDYLAELEQTPSSEGQLQGHEWIDAFLEHGQAVELPRQSPKPEQQQARASAASYDMSEHEAVEALIDTLPEESFSEALAKIYLKQKRYDKTLEIIKSLRLKYPEKNSYFADQIRFLEKLIELQQNN